MPRMRLSIEENGARRGSGSGASAKAFDQRDGFVAYANVLPVFDGVRDDPRFKALVARLKLPN